MTPDKTNPLSFYVAPSGNLALKTERNLHVATYMPIIESLKALIFFFLDYGARVESLRDVETSSSIDISPLYDACIALEKRTPPQKIPHRGWTALRNAAKNLRGVLKHQFNEVLSKDWTLEDTFGCHPTHLNLS